MSIIASPLKKKKIPIGELFFFFSSNSLTMFLYFAFFSQDINKRLSLPTDLHLPESFITKQLESPEYMGPLSRASRRQSLSEIGFGRTETYIKLRKLGQVCLGVILFTFGGRAEKKGSREKICLLELSRFICKA